MKVQSFDNQGFQARKDRNVGSYNPRRNPRANIDAVIALDDNSIKQIAYAKTVATVEDDKHRKISKGMFLSIPVVAGVATALLNPAKISVLGKNVTGVAGRLANGATSALAWGVMLGLASGVNAAVNKAEKSSPAFKKFTTENPVGSFIGQMAAFIGTVALAGKYLPKAAEGIIKHIKPETLNKAATKIAKGAENFNNNKITKTVAKYARQMSDSRYFEPLKGVVKTALNWSPSLLLWGGVLHSINHANTREREFVKNYSEMKDFQAKLAQARIRELTEREGLLNTKVQAHQA